ncbi:MAG: hypothetical protein ACRC1H_15100, partial [Caldilineaceae bacterium]
RRLLALVCAADRRSVMCRTQAATIPARVLASGHMIAMHVKRARCALHPVVRAFNTRDQQG